MSEPTADRPTKRRRTVTSILIAIVGLALLFGAARWLLRARVDPRLFGTWSVEVIGLNSPRSVLAFEADGAGIATPVAGSNSPPQLPFAWSIDDNRLHLMHDRPLRQRIGMALDVVFGGSSLPESDAEFVVIDVSEHEGVLESRAPDGTRVRWHLRRVD